MAFAPSTYRFLPLNGAAKTTVANGRVYSCAASGFVDALFADADTLGANGWVRVAGSGTTALRPTNPAISQHYFDSTLGFIIVFEGKAWRNPVSGAAV